MELQGSMASILRRARTRDAPPCGNAGDGATRPEPSEAWRPERCRWRSYECSPGCKSQAEGAYHLQTKKANAGERKGREPVRRLRCRWFEASWLHGIDTLEHLPKRLGVSGCKCLTTGKPGDGDGLLLRLTFGSMHIKHRHVVLTQRFP